MRSVQQMALKDITKYYEQESLISNSVSRDNLFNKKTRHLNWLLGVNKVNYKGWNYSHKKQKK